ncbi:TonB-dependent receptor [Alteromonas sp. a30]|uniref:TonB-dependent receptor n=1 Tax=Alteromonas sp. a30 TaxID=2730917 RepID=UPI00228056DE|nr:TonB-dependent receptor [Alteromonas sp. a30]MCY7296430.1 TonB-dependent receptor [Alteromonas sp. a30]
MLKFNKNILALSVATAVAGLPALAQDTSSENTEVIQVTGIRGALQRAQAIKMDETSIVEALSAEDIGKLPDTSVAESLARLPGLAGERRNGRVSGLSVRGFNENYIGTSFNGRELLGMGDNRGVEFDLYPTEIVSSIVVYKTPEAGLLTQGLGGTVDLRTVSPLNADSTLTFNGTYEKNQEDAFNPDFDDDGHRFSLNYVEKFADDKLGVALTFATMESPRQEEQFRGWGYTDADPAFAAEGVDVPEGTQILAGHDSYVRSALLERDSYAAIIEYAPTDNLKLQLDALYIDFEENDVKRGLEEGGPVWGGVDYTITGVEDGLVTSGYHAGFPSVVRNDARKQESDLTAFGLNIEYQINENWTIVGDFSTSEVEKDIIDIESYSGAGRFGTTDTIAPRSWVMTGNGALYGAHPTLPSVDLTDPNLVRLAGTNAWGHPLIGSDAQDGFVNRPKFEEELDSFRLSVNGFVEWGIFSKIDFGVNYSDRNKYKINNGAYLTAPDYPNDVPIPNPLGTVDLGFIGINGVIAYDSLSLVESGYYTETDAALVQADRLGDTYSVDEEIYTYFAKLTIDTEIGGIFVKGNVGLQVVDVEQSSVGFFTLAGNDEFGTISATPVSGGADYTDVLPTLNLSFEIAEDQYIRTALSKVMSRPRLDDLRPNAQVTFSFNDDQILSSDVENSPWGGSSGNAELDPLEANQFDIAYENYFADDAYFSVAFLYKDLKNWHRDLSIEQDFSEFYRPDLHQTSDGQAPVLLIGSQTSVLDGFEGFVRGWEFQTNLPLHHVHESLEGFGLFASATYMDGELEARPDIGLETGRIPGLSEELYSLTFYYENQGFEFRVSGTKRDDFLTEERGVSLALVDATDQGSEIWDAQVGYDFSESNIEWLHGLRVTLQAQNLTDEDTIQNNGSGDDRQITKFQRFGRNFLLGFNYSFY